MQKLKNLLSENDSEKFDDKLWEFSLNYVAEKVDITKLVNDGDIRLGIDKYSPNQYAIYNFINTMINERCFDDEALDFAILYSIFLIDDVKDQGPQLYLNDAKKYNYLNLTGEGVSSLLYYAIKRVRRHINDFPKDKEFYQNLLHFLTKAFLIVKVLDH